MNDSFPSALAEFFGWLKERTEKAWSNYSTRTFKQFQNAHSGGNDWQQGTKWLDGFSDDQIDSFEEVWRIKFPPDYRQFLRLLGAPDRPMYAVWYADASNMVQGEQPSFYNWRTDAEAIKKAMAWPLEGLLFDVEQNNLWLDSWGVRPSDAEGRQERVSELVSKAPSLVPVISHRYLLGTPVKAGNPVLSVYQSDIIIYGSDFRNFLTADLSDLLGLDHEEAYRRAIEGVPFSSIISIPFWGEIIGK